MSRIAVITGAGSGVGRATALAFIDAGYQVALIGRRAQPLTETLALRPGSGGHLALAFDIADEAAVDHGFAQIQGTLGAPDVLFNNAGLFGGGPFDAISLGTWRAVIDTNVTGAFLCARAAFRLMKAKGGRIINNGSLSAHVPRPQSAPYTCSKHAITGLTRSISLDGRPWNIACGQIDIGNAATELTAQFSVETLQADGSRRREPTMDVTKVAEAVLFMASLPLDANVQFMTIMAAAMPFIGRG
ncbi:MAG TPA: SDR family oxidoreductase [Steroidobacteraceae bacterium]|nr:SDR family oxidoreductase [Steroidobacteraceae bacterium]